MKRAISTALMAGAVLWGQSNGAPRYSKESRLALPDYRQWIFLASGLGMSYAANAPNANPPFENVFANPAAYQAFVKTGSWPDKTVLILELRHSDTRVSINREGAYRRMLRESRPTSRIPRGEAGDFTPSRPARGREP